MRNFDKNYSLVRMLHAVPGLETVDIYLNQDPFFYNMRFTNFSPYVYVPKGKYLMQVFPRDKKTNPIFEQEVEIDGGKLLTVALIGERGQLEILPIEEDTEVPQGNQSKVRLVNLVPDGLYINVYFDDEIFVSESNFRGISLYELMDPGTYRVEIELAENNQLIRKLRLTINPSRIYTIYVIGSKPNFQLFQSLDGATFL